MEDKLTTYLLTEQALARTTQWADQLQQIKDNVSDIPIPMTLEQKLLRERILGYVEGSLDRLNMR